jgi:ELWxxDGT repeat protein
MKKTYFSLISFLLILIQGASAQTFTGLDIWSGTGSSNPSGITSFNGKVYFEAEADTLHGYELWVSDGTQAGTMLLKDIWPGPGSSDPGNFYAVGSQLFFTADDSVHGYELWVTDGTTTGTVMVDDIWPGPVSGLDYFSTPCFTAFNGKLYFSADDSIHGPELWVSDGTQAGTSLVKDIWPGLGGSGLWGSALGTDGHEFVYTFHEFNGKLYFSADDSVHGGELWTTDGTTAGTMLVADIQPGTGSGDPYCIYTFNSSMIFAANGDSVSGFELWISDGTTAGTSLLKNIAPNSINSNSEGADVADYSGFTAFNGKAYFSAYSIANGYEMWATDGTSVGTTLVADVLPGPGSSDAGYWGFQAFNGSLYFIANDSVHGSEFFMSDGTTSGTTLLKTITSYQYWASTFDEHGFTVYNNQIMFRAAIDSFNLDQLFGSDGTASGTQILGPTIAPNTDPLNSVGIFAIANNMFFFNADFNSIGNELWVYTTPSGIIPIGGEQAISAYPNPFSSSVSISGLESSGQYCVQVTDMTGREFYNSTITNPSQNISVTMPDLSAGVYLMRVSGQGTSQTFKLVKN